MTLAWLVILYFFYDPYDRMFTPLGANSGFILNLMVSTLYVVLILKQPDADIAKFSTGVAWCKMLGTGLTTAVMFSIYPQNHLVHTLGILVFVLDCTYIYLLRMRKISVVPVPSP